MPLDCNIEIPEYVNALIGVNGGLASLRMMQVDTDGDYFTCEKDYDIDTIQSLLSLLIDTNDCNLPALRVDIVTDDGNCESAQTCNNGEIEWFTDLKRAIAKGIDGAPVLRIMLSSYS